MKSNNSIRDRVLLTMALTLLILAIMVLPSVNRVSAEFPILVLVIAINVLVILGLIYIMRLKSKKEGRRGIK